ncbi:sulfatase-like hydrolase/transferase [Reichenbachiella versicolor]|uniref:sulfatase-like hydrolase/transferase n=1 Tax=Reichenbachiella versicolor TaxID=1821036 RepID=UPI000D6E7EC8|nr:sulfatase-like hydrolase/transferase [Reichenbachiella versicolor]
MKRLLLVLVLVISGLVTVAQKQPNILWIITDDHRPDALECYNMATTGKKESTLGYVSSPNIDKLASEGTMFINAFCNSPACGPSRGSLHSGRYPFRTGHFGFVQTHQAPDFVKPSFPQTLQAEGYYATAWGKYDPYIFRWGPGQGFYDAGHYNYVMHFKNYLQKKGVGDLFTQYKYATVDGKYKRVGSKEVVKFENGRVVEYASKVRGEEMSKDDLKKRRKIEKELEILRSYTRGGNKELIIGGQNPMPANKTIDALVVRELKKFLENENSSYETALGDKVQGAKTNQPQMISLGFHLPHTPVLPPKKFRDVFKQKNYNIPVFEKESLNKLPPQLVKLYNNLNFDKMTKEEQLQAVQDYYAFCAHGDALIGEAVELFKSYCEKNNQEYLIIFTVGDHGWQLGEQGIAAKFGPWRQSVNSAIIMVSSDKNKIPAGKIKRQLIEYVDVAPTILAEAGLDISQEKFDYLDGKDLMTFMNNEDEQRDYVVGEINLVAGPRAYIRSNDFAFSMKTRPAKNDLNKNVKWAMTCAREKAEMALYDLRKDPFELNNLANDPAYIKLADWYRIKLGNIVLGDGRIECDWSKENSYNISTFAKGTHDSKLDIPSNIIP